MWVWNNVGVLLHTFNFHIAVTQQNESILKLQWIFFVSSEYKSVKLGCCLPVLVLQLLPVNQPRLSLQCPYLGRFSWLWIHLCKSWFAWFYFLYFLMTNYIILCLCNDTVCAGGWVMLPGKCFWFKNCLQAPSPRSWRVYLCGVLSTEVPAMPLPCGDRAVLGAASSKRDFLALCNSWSFLCSRDVFKQEILKWKE